MKNTDLAVINLSIILNLRVEYTKDYEHLKTVLRYRVIGLLILKSGDGFKILDLNYFWKSSLNTVMDSSV